MRRHMLLKYIRIVAFLFILSLITTPLWCQTGGPYILEWSTIDGGGGTSSGGQYVLSGTIGQPDAGYSSGGNYELLGGFWPGGPLCIIEFDDFARFAEVWLESAIGLTSDLDGDNDVDIWDLSRFANYWLSCCPYDWRLDTDLCPDDPNKTQPGICGCGVKDIDINGDGISDCGFKYGDISGEGEVSSYDAALVSQCSQGLIELSELQRFAADVSGNGCVSDVDSALIAQYAVGLITVFPVEQMNPKPSTEPICGCP